MARTFGCGDLCFSFRFVVSPLVLDVLRFLSCFCLDLYSPGDFDRDGALPLLLGLFLDVLFVFTLWQPVQFCLKTAGFRPLCRIACACGWVIVG